MDLLKEIETTIYDFSINGMPPKRTAKRILALIEKDNKERQTSEAVVQLNDLLVAQAKLIDAVWKMAGNGIEDVKIHECSATKACHAIVDEIKAVMLTGK